MSLIKKKSHYQKVITAKCILMSCISLFLLFSCSDYGCVDADDFGDFENTTVRVYANPKSNDCVFGDLENADLILITERFGNGLRKCLTQDSKKITVYDESGSSSDIISKCNSFSTYADKTKYQKTCITDCINQCELDSATSRSYYTSSYVSIGGSQITIDKDTEIKIRATGKISLGGSLKNQSSMLINDPKFNKLIPYSNFQNVSIKNISGSDTISINTSPITATENKVIDKIITSNLTCTTTGANPITSKSANSESVIENYFLGKSVPNSIKVDDLFKESSTFCPSTSSKSLEIFYNQDHESLYFAKNQKPFFVEYSGDWNDVDDSGASPANTSDHNLLKESDVTKTDFTTNSATVLNGSRRIVAYIQPTPSKFQNDPTYPTKPNPLAWNCKYNLKDDFLCSPEEYLDDYHLFKTNQAGTDKTAFDKELSEYFQVDNSSEILSVNLSKEYGSYGFIRYKDDFLKPDNSPLSSLSENDHYQKISELPGNPARTSFTFSPAVPEYAYKIAFTTTEKGCSSNISYSIYNSSNNRVLNSLANPTIPTGSATSANWSTEEISLEKNHKLQIDFSSPLNSDCAEKTYIRFLKYRDVEIAKSGFVRFSIINDAKTAQGAPAESTPSTPPLSPKCTINARIINPKNSPYPSPSTTNEFYEYSTSDPLQGLDVKVTDARRTDSSSSPKPIFPTKEPLKTTKPIFVRKGQIIRFDPSSWNGSWISPQGDNGANKVSIECGKGLIMQTEPRPAVICNNTKIQETIDNKNCIKNDTGGCQPSSVLCDVIGSNTYCPGQCRLSVSCSGTPQKCTTDTTYPCKTATTGGCGDLSYQSTITNSATSVTTAITTTTTSNSASTSTDASKSSTQCLEYPKNFSSKDHCDQCAIAMKTAGEQGQRSTRIGNYSKCFDLEDYEGSVSTISYTDISSFNSLISNKSDQKLRELKFFNGEYGNLSDSLKERFSSTGKKDTETNSVVFKTDSMIPSIDGILNFLIIDGDNFSSFSNLNNISSDPYQNNTGKIKIAISEGSEFTNGKLMQVNLCKENSPNGQDCLISGNQEDPKIINFSGEETEPNPSISNYQFNSDGDLFRTSEVSDQNYECKNLSKLGSEFFCYNPISSTLDPAIYRLTFKIIDPKTAECYIEDPSQNCLANPPPLCDSNQNPAGCSSSPPKKCNGIKIKNILHENKPTNNGITCGFSESDCKKEFICTSSYNNNSGFYDVLVKVKKPSSNSVSGVINKIIAPVLDIIDGTESDDPQTDRDERIGMSQYLYKKLVNDPYFKAVLTMMTVLMITFYGMGYFIGVSELKQSEISNRLIKIGIIYIFASQSGWTLFNEIFVNFFKGGADYLTFVMANAFDNSENIEKAISTNSYHDKNPLFFSVDRVVGLFLNETIHKKIGALLFHNFFGIVYLAIIYWSILLYMYAISNAVLIYLTSQFFTSVLFAIGPLFIIFLTFKKTKSYFDNWLNSLIGFALQQIFLIFTLSMFNYVIYELVKLTLAFKVCWGEVWTIDIVKNHISLLSFWEPNSSPSYLRTVMSKQDINSSGSVPSFPMMLSLWGVSSLMLQFIGYITSLSSRLSDGMSASELGRDISNAMAGAIEKVNNIASSGWKKTGEELTKRADQYLFDSGEKAKIERTKQRREIKNDKKTKSEMSKAGNAAIKEFKQNSGNALEFSKLSENQKQQKLSEIREKGMKDYARKMGYTEGKIDSLMKDKGVKYVGDNAFGLLKAGFFQGAVSGGGLLKSLSEKNKMNNSSFSLKESRNAMKGMDEKQRSHFVSAAESGNIKIKKTNRDKFNEAFRANTTLGIGKKTYGATKAALTYVPSKAIEAVKNFRKEVRDYNKAEKDLEKEGKIKVMKKGFANLGRDKKEKEAIKERAQENRFAKMENAENKSSDIARLNAEAKYLNEKDKIKKDGIKDSGESSINTKEIKEKKKETFLSMKEEIERNKINSKIPVDSPRPNLPDPENKT